MYILEHRQKSIKNLKTNCNRISKIFVDLYVIEIYIYRNARTIRHCTDSLIKVSKTKIEFNTRKNI